MFEKNFQLLFLTILFAGILCEANVGNQQIDTKFNYNSEKTAKKGSVELPGVVDISHNGDIGYLTKVYVANGQLLNLQLDLGSSLTWITNTSCESKCASFCQIAALCRISCQGRCCIPPNSNPNYACLNKHKFNPATPFQPTRAKSEWTIEKGEQHTVRGEYGKVNFSFGENPISVNDVEFGLANLLSLSFTLRPVDGVLGLAKKANNDEDVKPIVSNLPVPLFQLALKQCSKNEAFCGKLAFGSEALMNYCKAVGSITFKTNKNDWQFQITNFELNGNSKEGKWQVALNINDPLITLTVDLFKMATSSISSIYDENTGLYKVDCSTKIQLKISQNGRNLLLNQNVLLTKNEDNCYLQIQPKFQFDKSTIDITFGVSAISNYCQTFKLKEETITFYELL